MIKVIFFGELPGSNEPAPKALIYCHIYSKKDLDDTLVPTTAADREALAHVKVELLQRFSYSDLYSRVLLDAFQDSLRDAPWDPEGKIDSDTWRRQLWLQSLQKCDNEIKTSENKEHGSPFGNGGTEEVDDGVDNVNGTNGSPESETGQVPFTQQRLARECWSLWSSSRLEKCRMSKKTAGALCLIREKREKDALRLGVITNGRKDVQLQKLKACGIESFADVIFIGDDLEASCEGSFTVATEDGEVADGRDVKLPCQEKCGDHCSILIHRAKPCPSIFQAACDAVGCAPSEAIMVGDSFEVDVCGAANAGFAAAIMVTGQATDLKTSDRDPNDKKAAHTQIINDSCKTLVLQCCTVAEVPGILRERRMIP